jgi:hypothetical protein
LAQIGAAAEAATRSPRFSPLRRNEQHKGKTMRRIYDDKELPSGRVLEDGEGIRVFMADGKPQDQRCAVADATVVSKYMALCAYRPSYCVDQLKALPYRRALEFGLQSAIEAREAAHDAQYNRELWRTGGAVVGDQNDPDNGSDDDDGPEDNSDDDDEDKSDESELEKALSDKEAAYQEAVQRSQNAWRTMGGADYGAVPVRPLDPNRATAVEAEGERWKAETGKHR